jgi:Na+-transporting methylmalonyl-CoA/oxaloacetate decarboxylase gamma subunit
MDTIWQGLSLSALGIGLTFAALGLLILAMFILERIFRTRRLIPEERSPEEAPAASSLARDMREEETVVAIAVALAYLRSLDMSRSGLGEALEAGPGPWGMKHITRGSR